VIGKLSTATPTTQIAMAEEGRHGFVTAAADDQALDTPAGAPLTFVARAEQTGGSVTAFETRAAPGQGPPLHSHAREDEVLYVVQGRLRVRLGESTYEAPAGSFMFFPRGVPHTWQSAGDVTARFLVVFTPASPGMEEFFDRSAKLGDDERAEGFKRFATDAGMEILGPPLAESDAVT
jgi:quercetin dioxygenase-like cupin family protein